MTNLKPVNEGNNKFCGPAVLSILTGISTDEAASILSSIQNRIEVREVTVEDMKKALKRLRFTMELVPLTENASMYFAYTSLYNQPGLYVVMVRKHVVAVEVTDTKEIYICDNHSKEPLNAANSARLGQKCLGIYKVTKKPEPVLVREFIETSKKYNGIYITRVQQFEDPEDNVIANLGYITTKDDDELFRVVTTLMAKYNVF